MEYDTAMDENKPILFFDGDCNLCNSFIDLLIRIDGQHRVYIASLQGETAQKLLPQDIRTNLKSLVFLDQGQLHEKSSGVFRLALLIKGPLLFLVPFWVFPRFFTNWIYDLVALSRYSLFGRRPSCRLPTEEEKQYFLP